MSRRSAFNLANSGIEEAKPVSHYIPSLTRIRNGQQETVCGVYISADRFSTEPTCEICQAWLEQDASGFESIVNAEYDPRDLVKPTHFESTAGYRPKGGTR